MIERLHSRQFIYVFHAMGTVQEGVKTMKRGCKSLSSSWEEMKDEPSSGQHVSKPGPYSLVA